MFTPPRLLPAHLFAPPIGWGVITSAGDAWERIGRVAWSGFGGVLMIEAIKRIYIEPGKAGPREARREGPAGQKRCASRSGKTFRKRC